MATRTVSNTGGNWSATTAWVGGVVPLAGDDVVFTATSGNLTVNVSTASLSGINFTNYVGTITINEFLNVGSGTINLGTGGYTQAGTNGFAISGTVTLTSNGVVWSRILRTAGTNTVCNLTDNWTNTGLVNMASTVSTTLNGNSLNVGASLSQNCNISGTTTIVFNGTGTWTSIFNVWLRNNVNINTAGTFTISGIVYYGTGIFTYTAGTVVTSGSTLTLQESTTFNSGSMNWNNVSTGGSTYTITLQSNFNITGTFSFGHSTLSFAGTTTLNPSGTLVVGSGTTTIPNSFTVSNATLINSAASAVLNSNTINIAGNLSSSSTGICSGTTNLVLSGNGTWSNASTAQIRNNLTINTPGTIIVSGTVYYNTGTLTYTAGTVVTTGSTLVVGAATTLVTNGMTWSGFQIGGSITITLSNNMTLSGTLQHNSGTTVMNGNTIFVGGSIGIGQASTGTLGGTTLIVLNGTGSWLGIFTLTSNLTINTTGTISLSANPSYNTGTITYTAGSVVTTGSALNLGSCTLATNGIIWNSITTSSSTTITLTNNFTFIGTLNHQSNTLSFVLNGNSIISSSASLNQGSSTTLNVPQNMTFSNFDSAGGVLNGNKISLTGNLSHSSNTNVTGTTQFVLAGTGTVSSISGGAFTLPLTINTPGTIIISSFFKKAGPFNYISGTVISTGATIELFGSTHSLNGVTFSTIVFAGGTYNLTSNMNVTNLTINASSVANISNIIIGGNLSSNTSVFLSGTSSVILVGTGTIGFSLSSAITCNLIINTPGTITIAGTLNYSTGNLTYTSGNVITTNSTLGIGAASTLATNGINWNNITITGTTTTTLTNNLTSTGTFSLGAASSNVLSFTGPGLLILASASVVTNCLTFNVPHNLTVTNLTVDNLGIQNFINSFQISVLRNFTNNNSSVGNTRIIMAGTGTFSSPANLRNNLTFNTSGTVFISGSNFFQFGIITYTAGNIVTTGSTLTVDVGTFNATPSLITQGIIWNNINFGVSGGFAPTIVLVNPLTATGTVSLDNSCTFRTSGFTVGRLVLSTVGTTQIFVSGQTYAITDSFACTNSTDASRIILRGSVTASKVNLVLSSTATQDLGFVNAIDINSSAGKKIYSYKGTFSNTDNWFQLPTTAVGGEKIITFSG